MKVRITSRGFTPKQNQVDYIEKRFAKLEKFFSEETEAAIILKSKRNMQTLEATIHAKGISFRAENTDPDMNTSVDRVIDKLMTQITKYKKKLQKKHHKGGGILFDAVPEADTEAEPELRPVREKRFSLDAMDTEEAILQMELLDHSFFLFLNSETGTVCTVYRRADGSYGLLRPEY